MGRLEVRDGFYIMTAGRLWCPGIPTCLLLLLIYCPPPQFIESRLEKLNNGEGFSDQFEQEISSCGASSGALRSYQLWADNLKAKSGLKGVQSLLMYKDGDSNLQRWGSLRVPALTSRSDRLQQRLPITQHFGQPNIPRWQPDHKKLPEPQPLSLSADLLSLQNAPSLDATSSSKDPRSQLIRSESDQQVISPSQTSPASADPRFRGDPEPSPLIEPLILPLTPSYKAAEDSRAQEDPTSWLSPTPNQPSPPESPQILAPTKPSFDKAWTAQHLDPSADPSSVENSRAQPPKALLAEHAPLQPLEELGAPDSPTSNWQKPQPSSRPRVADLKKCFEG
ncbi:hypothetical protein P7K49_033085 [Saguinus oedipus]|uniref:Uncharacterized protein n=1 Tax=Saguinus oedipus TaxID=9490 RepID=A0ABQ9TQY1_SAGOE|nr:hypothetical protein P7K49_033085 [Saguinus oedipus]